MHSPMGGSSAHRLIACPGSYKLIQGLAAYDDTSPEGEEWREQGTQAHALGAECIKAECDAWEGAEKFPSLKGEDAIAVQVYLDYVRSSIQKGAKQRVEFTVEAQHIHRLLWGSLDYAQQTQGFVEIIDYKHGAGVVVETENNEQLLYYAFCLLNMKGFEDVETVKMTICQPRAFHPAGPVRSWECSAALIHDWGNSVLVPMMVKAEAEDCKLVTGVHCQFCPGKDTLSCPAILGDFNTILEYDQELAASPMSDDKLGEFYALIPTAMFVRKALEKEVLRRRLLGIDISNSKLVRRKTDRVYKDGAEAVITQRFGEDAFDKKLKSPAQLEKIPGGKEVVKNWAYSPDAGVTVAPLSDKRKAVEPPKAADAFQTYAATHQEEGDE